MPSRVSPATIGLKTCAVNQPGRLRSKWVVAAASLHLRHLLADREERLVAADVALGPALLLAVGGGALSGRPRL